MAKKAKESSQIEKARKKIEKNLMAEEKQINKEALNRMRLLIETQLRRQSVNRISLKKRQIVLFDENRHPAKTESKFIVRLLEEIKKGRPIKQKLKGRIKSINQR